jgi:hypothetical protein
MKIQYPFDTTALDPANPNALNAPNNAKNLVIGVTFGDYQCIIEPQGRLPANTKIEVPAHALRNPAVAQSGIVVPAAVGGDIGPHEDWMFIQASQIFTYITRTVVGSGVVEKRMAAGAKVGDLGTMVLYQGATSVAGIDAGGWTARLVRPFVITANDLTNRQGSGNWPNSGTAPTIDTTNRRINDTGGEGYFHV